MFDLKNIFQMQAKAREVQKKLATEIIEVEYKGIKIKMNGNQEVLAIEINPEYSKSDQEKYLVEALNQALKKVQQLMAKMMMEM